MLMLARPIRTSHPNQIKKVAGEKIVELNKGFTWFTTKPNAFHSAYDIPLLVKAKPAIIPGTVAMLPKEEIVSEEGNILHTDQLDQYDHWYQTRFQFERNNAKRLLLHFDGLLTIAEVYLNGKLILQSTNAYHVNIVDITQTVKGDNHLAICFRALQPIYSTKKPRAKYMTKLVNERHLRFIRTPVLGYTPGFSSDTKHVGPYRPIKLIYQNSFNVVSSIVNTRLIGEHSGGINIALEIEALEITQKTATLTLTDLRTHQVVGTHAVEFLQTNHKLQLNRAFTFDFIEPYWPHTHGEPKRYILKLNIDSQIIELGEYGFKHISRVKPNTFTLKVNNAALFLRGACWTPMNADSLLVSKDTLHRRLVLLRDAGINLLRISGNMLYESDDFYAICDELGIFVFQDFAFTNFEYPEDNESFIASVEKEIADFLSKHGGRPCLLAVSGGSEVAQQASMMGLHLSEINQTLFTKTLPELVRAFAPNVQYVVSSPYSSQGLPFHTGDGPSHYFGVGGYRRSFEDARLFKGRFITECLPFSHIPEDKSLRQFWGGEILPVHHPLWKEGVTRDIGSGWDFADITDFYVEKLFEVDTLKLRATHQARYLNYCRATLVEVVETTLSIFRADTNEGRAALVWNLHDLKAGAGWGYIDSLGNPKSAFYGLARASQPTTCLFVDEGLEGLAIYVAHDAAHKLSAKLTISLVTAEGKLFKQESEQIFIAPRSVQRISVDTVIGHFVDSSYAYMFGPREFISCVAQLADGNGHLICEKIYAPPITTHQITANIGLSGSIGLGKDGHYWLSIRTKTPAYYVSIDIDGFEPSDNYFHVLPQFSRNIQLKPQAEDRQPYGRLSALNIEHSVTIKIQS
jgi:beta-mannosidase